MTPNAQMWAHPVCLRRHAGRKGASPDVKCVRSRVNAHQSKTPTGRSNPGSLAVKMARSLSNAVSTILRSIAPQINQPVPKAQGRIPAPETLLLLNECMRNSRFWVYVDSRLHLVNQDVARGETQWLNQRRTTHSPWDTR